MALALPKGEQKNTTAIHNFYFPLSMYDDTIKLINCMTRKLKNNERQIRNSIMMREKLNGHYLLSPNVCTIEQINK